MADLARDNLVVAGENLYLNTPACQRRNRLASALFGRIEEGDVAEEREIGLVLDGIGRFRRIHLPVGNCHDTEAVRIKGDRLLLRRLEMTLVESPCLSVDGVPGANCKDLLDRALADEDVFAVLARHHDREAASREVERDLVDLGIAAANSQLLVEVDMGQDGVVEQVSKSRLKVAVQKGVLEHPLGFLAADIEMPLQDDAVLG